MARYANKQNLMTLVEALRGEYQTPSWVKDAEELGGGLNIIDSTLTAAVTEHSDGSQAGPILSLSAKGWAEQGSTTGKNLLPNTATSQTINGVTFTVNADGSVTANGTASSSAALYLAEDASYPITDATYTVSVGAQGSIGYAIKTSEQGWIDVPRTHRLSGEIQSFWIRVAAGATVSNLTFYPQLELGSTATDYEPYTGGAPSPSPDYPQEIRVARGHEVSGKTGRFVDLVVKQGDTTLSTTPIPLPSRGWVASLPDGTADTLTLDGAGKVTWERKTNETTQAVTDGVTGTVGVDVLSTTGQIADGATVLYKLTTPVTEDAGYIEMPEIPVGAELRIPELDDLGVDYIIPLPVVLKDYEDRIAALEEAVADLVTGA